VNSTILTICKNGTKITGTFERNGSRIRRIRKTERSDVDDARLNWFQQEGSDIVRVSGPLLMITFVLPKF
jgi:hypothetical protein